MPGNSLVLFRPSKGKWFYDFEHDGSTDRAIRGIGRRGDIPLAGDLDSDNKNDGMAVFKTKTTAWIYDLNHNGSRDSLPGIPTYHWGFSGEPLHTTHKQYFKGCGPASLNMVMEYLHMTDHTNRLFFNKDLNESIPAAGSWDGIWGITVDVGYYLSMEHIYYEGLYRNWQLGELTPGDFLSAAGELNNADTPDYYGLGKTCQIEYELGEVKYNPASGTTGRIQKWL